MDTGIFLNGWMGGRDIDGLLVAKADRCVVCVHG